MRIRINKKTKFGMWEEVEEPSEGSKEKLNENSLLINKKNNDDFNYWKFRLETSFPNPHNKKKIIHSKSEYNDINNILKEIEAELNTSIKHSLDESEIKITVMKKQNN